MQWFWQVFLVDRECAQSSSLALTLIYAGPGTGVKCYYGDERDEVEKMKAGDPENFLKTMYPVEFIQGSMKKFKLTEGGGSEWSPPPHPIRATHSSPSLVRFFTTVNFRSQILRIFFRSALRASKSTRYKLCFVCVYLKRPLDNHFCVYNISFEVPLFMSISFCKKNCFWPRGCSVLIRIFFSQQVLKCVIFWEYIALDFATICLFHPQDFSFLI